MSPIFKFGIPREYCTTNPRLSIERLEGGEGYEPWDMPSLTYLITHGRERVVWVALMALYIGHDVLAMCDAEIEGELWERRRGKIRRKVKRGALISVRLHPVAMGIVEACREIKRRQGILDPHRPPPGERQGHPVEVRFQRKLAAGAEAPGPFWPDPCPDIQ